MSIRNWPWGMYWFSISSFVSVFIKAAVTTSRHWGHQRNDHHHECFQYHRERLVEMVVDASDWSCPCSSSNSAEYKRALKRQATNKTRPVRCNKGMKSIHMLTLRGLVKFVADDRTNYSHRDGKMPMVIWKHGVFSCWGEVKKSTINKVLHQIGDHHNFIFFSDHAEYTHVQLSGDLVSFAIANSDQSTKEQGCCKRNHTNQGICIHCQD